MFDKIHSLFIFLDIKERGFGFYGVAEDFELWF
jgi:hypothetical protein